MRSTQDLFNARYVVRSTNHGCDAIAARQKRCSLSVVGHIHAETSKAEAVLDIATACQISALYADKC